MKNLLNKVVVNLLGKIEQALIASVSLHEIGLSPIETSCFLPIIYTGIWETQYFNTLITAKLEETTEQPISS